ncbi:M20/M25/M40 family metallo-hydrolase [Bacillus sp. HMF5848]|uniref:M28 family peptidase n=1 Tax=Bacillus sp. HMF5848 TaxID=2495421 RepID=UPI000F7A0FB6|nr:M28 family peptidase [Bacillus sp. HMF5848]RSK25784.1 M20/M25/M40 family metallo-hydrolase [Bacillus sp. HMF5848]
MKIKNILAWTFYLLVIVGVIYANHVMTPEAHVPKKEDTAPTEFSAEYALEHIQKIAQQPRPAGSAYNKEVRQYIKSQIEGLGFVVNEGFHTVKHKYEDRMIDVYNITTTIKGTDNTGEILFMSHYDSVDEGPGANDNAQGVAIMIETLKILKNSAPLKNDVTFFFTDGEEYGVLGSTAYAKSNNLEDIGLVVNLEARGNKGKSMLFETNENNYEIVKEYLAASSKPYGYSFLNDIYKLLPNYTDYEPFKKEGVKGLNFSYNEGFEVYHNASDTIESVTLSSVQHNGLYATELAEHFGNIDFQSKQTEEKAVYFNLFGYHTVMYKADYNLILSGIALVLTILVFLLAIKKQVISVTNIRTWLITAVVSMIAIFFMATLIIACIAVYQLFSLVAVLIPIAIGLLVVTIMTFVSRKFKLVSKLANRVKILTILDIILANLLIGFVLTGLCTLYLPNSHYLFAITVILQSFTLSIQLACNAKGTVAFLMSFVYIIPATLILFPLLYVIGLSGGIVSSPFVIMVLFITVPYVLPLNFRFQSKAIQHNTKMPVHH